MEKKFYNFVGGRLVETEPPRQRSPRRSHEHWLVASVKNSPEKAFLNAVLVVVAAFCLITCWRTVTTLKAAHASLDAIVVDTNEQVATEMPVVTIPSLEEMMAAKAPSVNAEAVNVISYNIPVEEDGTKTWMDYRSITAESSKQWALQQNAWTDGLGFRRYGDDGLYMVAVGTFYAQECGKVLTIELESGFRFKAIVGDIKKDADVDEKCQHADGNVLEFIVDRDFMPDMAKVMGDMSYASDCFEGHIKAIEWQPE